MAMMMPREKWTDERLDDLNKKVDKGFAGVDADIRELRSDMNGRFEKVDARFDRIDARFDRIDARFESLYKVLIGSAATIIAALIGLNAF